MMTSTPSHSGPPDRRSGFAGRAAWLKRAGFALGLVLLAAAVILVLRRRETISLALDAVAAPDPVWLATLLASVAANIVLSGLFLRVLVAKYGRVGWIEMQAVVAAATLLNFLPLRPGLFGRAAYHASVNGIALADTARSVVEAAVITAALALWLAGAATLSMSFGWSLWPAAVAPWPLLVIIAIVSPRRRRVALAAAIRHVEMFVWALRYLAAFALLDAPIHVNVALAFACVSVIATMVPFVSNGLGLREWAIGLLAPILTDHALELGVTAELLNRGAELTVVVAAGLAGAGWVGRRRGRRRGTEAQRH